MARRDSGFVVPLTVIDRSVPEDELEFLGEATAEAERIALTHGAEAAGLVRIDRTPTNGILHTMVEKRGSLLVLGWSGRTGRGGALFSSVIDRVLAEAPAPMLVARLQEEEPTGILLSISESNTTPVGEASLALALETAKRLASRDDLPIRVISNIDDATVRARVRVVLAVDMLHDARRRSIAVRGQAEPGDLVIIPVKPEAKALRGVAARIARAVPDHSIVMAIDVTGALLPEVRAKEQPAPVERPLESAASRTASGDPAPPLGGRAP